MQGRRLFISGYYKILNEDYLQVRQRLLEQPVTTLVISTPSLIKWKWQADVSFCIYFEVFNLHKSI